MPGLKTMHNTTQKFSPRWLATDRPAPFLQKSSMHSGANRSSLSVQANYSPEHRFQVRISKLRALPVHVGEHVCGIQPGLAKVAFGARTCARTACLINSAVMSSEVACQAVALCEVE